MSDITRREMMKWSAMFTAGACLGGRLFAAETGAVKLLYFTKSTTYQHSVVTRHGDDLAFSERILIDLGKPLGFDITPSKDGSLFTAEKLAAYDGFVFFTQGNLTLPGLDKQTPMTADGKQALLDAVAGGKGFVGIHCASDTFHSHGNLIDPYIAMLGGEFISHGAQQDSTSHVVDPKFPGSPQKDFTLHEEWYALKNFAKDLHVILKQETAGMKGDVYQRPPYPSTWAKTYGKGKVFYTSMGHREDMWTNPLFTQLLMSGISWAMGKTDAEIPPNLTQ